MNLILSFISKVHNEQHDVSLELALERVILDPQRVFFIISITSFSIIQKN